MIARRLTLHPNLRQASATLRHRPSTLTSATKTRSAYAPKTHAPVRRSGGKADTAKDAPPSAGAASAGKASAAAPKSPSSSSSWWDSAEFWGRCGALAGWGMSGAAIYDAVQSSPELISLNMTGVLIVYSSLFARWAFVVKPQNLLLAGCHVTNVAAQANQLRRAVEYKRECGKDDEVNDILMKAGATAAGGAACVVAGPMVQSAIVNANIGVVSTLAAAEAGPL